MINAPLLILEDNYLIACSLRRAIESLGQQVLGPAPSVAIARQLIADQPIIGAILDINVLDGTTEEFATQLLDRRLPFFFMTGYGSRGVLSEALAQVPRLIKPIDDKTLIETFTRLIAANNCDENPSGLSASQRH